MLHHPRHTPISPTITAAPTTPSESLEPAKKLNVSEQIVEMLSRIGVTLAFGITGGTVAPFTKAISESKLRFIHCRHEAGAAFAAIEASLALGKPTLVACTSGPGLSNLLTGFLAAKAEGAQVLFVSGTTPPALHGRGAFQETGGWSAFGDALFESGKLLSLAASLTDPRELPSFLNRLAVGFANPQGFVAHLGLPLSLQSESSPEYIYTPPNISSMACTKEVIQACIEDLDGSPFVIWVGHGSRHASAPLRTLVERTGASVMCTPRGKGIFPELDPHFIGVTGLGGYGPISEHLSRLKPKTLLVLGTRLGEMSSFWDETLTPVDHIIQIDTDPGVFGTAYPQLKTHGIQADIRSFLQGLIEAWPQPTSLLDPPFQPLTLLSSIVESNYTEAAGIRPSRLMQSLQHEVVEGADASIITEAGNAFAWTTHHLRFSAPNRYRVSSSFGSMGHAGTGVLGVALANRKKAFAVLGDGSMLMLNELSTAAQYNIPAVWVVLNDARYGMIEQGMKSLGWTPFETQFPRVDFVGVAQAMGVAARRLTNEAELVPALQEALHTPGPYLLDVLIDPSEQAPTGRRNHSLQRQQRTGGLAA